MIEKIYVKPYVLELYCDDCNVKMELQQNKINTQVYPIEYIYKCPNCNKEIISTSKFDQIEYEKVEEYEV